MAWSADSVQRDGLAVPPSSRLFERVMCGVDGSGESFEASATGRSRPARKLGGGRTHEQGVLEARGPERPHLVRWDDDGRVTLIYPGPDASVEHFRRGRADGVVSAYTTPVGWFQQ